MCAIPLANLVEQIVVVEATVDFAMLEKCTVHVRDRENDR